MDRGKTVQKLFDGFCKAYPLKSRQANQDACHAYWRSIKDKSDCDKLAQLKIKELQNMSKAPSGTLMSFFKTVPSVPSLNTQSQLSSASTIASSDDSELTATPSSSHQTDSKCATEATKETKGGKFACPKQDELKKELEAVNAEISCLLLRERNSIISVDQEKELKLLKNKKCKIEAGLIKLKSDQQRQRDFRIQRKRAMDHACESDPSLANKLRFKKDVGRPAIEVNQPQFIKTLLDIAQHGASADDRRR